MYLFLSKLDKSLRFLHIFLIIPFYLRILLLLLQSYFDYIQQ